MADITQTCVQCGKKFLVIDVEQEFLKKKRLPIPTLCPTDRQARRLAGRGERTLYKTTCRECSATVITSYDPKTVTSPVLCRTCYEAYFDKNDPIIP